MSRPGLIAVSLGAVAAMVAFGLWLSQAQPETPLLPPDPAVKATVDAAADAHADAIPVAAPPTRHGQHPPDTSWADQLSDPEDAPVAMDPAADGAAVLRGRLTVRQQPWQHPAGVEVRLTRSWLDTVIPTRADAATRAPRSDEPRAITDADGVFTVGLLPDAGELFFVIGRGTEWHDFQKVKAVPRTPGIIDLGDVLLDQRGSIRGKVVDPWGAPVAGVLLRAIDDPLTDASTGFDELREARNAGIANFRADGSVASGPMPDWVARRDTFLPFRSTTSRGDGSFELAGLRPGSHDLFATGNPTGRGTGSSRGVLVGAGAVTDIGELKLSGSEPVRITVVDEVRKPWVGAPVAFVHRDSGFGTTVLRTDRRGDVQGEVPAVAEHDLLFGYSETGPWIRLPLPAWGDRIVVARPRALRIALCDAAGNPLAGGSVRGYFASDEFRPVDRLLPASMQPRETAPGEHRCQRAGAMILIASAPRHAPAVAVVPAEENDVLLTLLPLLSMTVRTRDLDGQPVAGATVRLRVHSDPTLRHRGAEWSALANGTARVGRTDQNGEVVIPVWGTMLSLQATHPDFAPSAGPRRLGTAGAHQEIVLRKRAEVYGRLLMQQRPAPKGYRVRAKQRPPADHELADSDWLVEEVAVTGEDGTFTFPALPAGLWEFAPELPALPGVRGAAVPTRTFRKQTHQLDDGQVLHCVLEAQQDQLAAASLFGTVTQNGATIGGAVVRLRRAEASSPVHPEPRSTARDERRRRPSSREPEAPAPGNRDPDPRPWTHRCDTDVLGDYRFSDLPAGDYELRVDLPRQGRLQLLAQRQVQIGGRNTPPQSLPIALLTGQVQLTCSRFGQPVPFRMLRLRQDGEQPGGRFEVLLDRLGTADLEALPSGTWHLEPVHGGECQPASFDLLPGQGLSLAIEFADR